jgi:hypothetical protein
VNPVVLLLICVLILAALTSSAMAIAACILNGRNRHDGGWCRCSHPEQAHRHYRPGSDCGQCQCPRFRPADWDQAMKELQP